MTPTPHLLDGLARRLAHYSDAGLPAPHALRGVAKAALMALGYTFRTPYPSTAALALAATVAAVDLDAAADHHRRLAG